MWKSWCASHTGICAGLIAVLLIAVVALAGYAWRLRHAKDTMCASADQLNRLITDVTRPIS